LIPSHGAVNGSLTQRFANPTAVFETFDHALRGDGYFAWDAGLGKEFHLTEHAKLQFRCEMLNIKNSVRFDSHWIGPPLDNPQNFGQTTGLLTICRRAQFSGRIEF